MKRADLPKAITDLCASRDWSMHWANRGCYLHLEASELIEALRGKREHPMHEAADVLIVLMSITENAGIEWTGVEEYACEKVGKMLSGIGGEFGDR